MIRTPLRPLARILRAREKGENPDAIEAENRAQRHAEIQDRARSSARSRARRICGDTGSRVTVWPTVPDGGAIRTAHLRATCLRSRSGSAVTGAKYRVDDLRHCRCLVVVFLCGLPSRYRRGDYRTSRC